MRRQNFQPKKFAQACVCVSAPFRNSVRTLPKLRTSGQELGLKDFCNPKSRFAALTSPAPAVPWPKQSPTSASLVMPKVVFTEICVFLLSRYHKRIDFLFSFNSSKVARQSNISSLSKNYIMSMAKNIKPSPISSILAGIVFIVRMCSLVLCPGKPTTWYMLIPNMTFHLVHNN